MSVGAGGEGLDSPGDGGGLRAVALSFDGDGTEEQGRKQQQGKMHERRSYGVEPPSAGPGRAAALKGLGAWGIKGLVTIQARKGPDEAQMAVGPGGLLFDADAVAPCVAAIEALACHEVDRSIPPKLPAACDEIFCETAAIGEPCNPGCARGATCLIGLGDPWCSHCVKRLVEGEACTEEPADGRCASGLVCSGGKCARPRAIEQGQPCDRFDDAALCEAGSYCAESNLCEPRKTSGSCFWSDECAPGFSCVEGECQRWKSRGAACSSPDECEPHAACSDPGGCDAEPFFVFFKAGVGLGQSCAEEPCQTALSCSEQSSVCELRPLCE
ncbi:MAG: hypothetical protein ACOX6T_02090 [Myxococcales bacterium]